MKTPCLLFSSRLAGLALFLASVTLSASAASVRLLPYGGNLLDARVGFGDRAQPALFFANTLSSVYEQKTGEPFLLTREVPVPEGQEPIQEILARADPLPEGVDAVLYLLSPAPAGSPTPWRLTPIIEDGAALRKGSVRVLNFSELTIAVRIGEEGTPSILPPQGQGVLQRASDEADVRIEVAGRAEEGWELVVGRNYGFHPSERSILLVTPGVVGPTGESNGLLTTTLIRERLAATPPTNPNK